MSARDAARFLIGATAAFWSLGSASAQMQASLPLDMIDAEARALAQEAAPDAEFYEASLEVGDEQGHNTVELTGRDPEGGHVEVDLFQEGARWGVDEIERYVSWEETPAAVKDELAALYSARWRPTLIERSERPNGVFFEIEGIDRYDERFELELGEDGALISLSKFNAS